MKHIAMTTCVLQIDVEPIPGTMRLRALLTLRRPRGKVVELYALARPDGSWVADPTRLPTSPPAVMHADAIALEFALTSASLMLARKHPPRPPLRVA